jgi:hypothetical protein
VTSMAIVTPSSAPDFELCRDLHASVLRWANGDVERHIIVPRDGLELFAALHGLRCVVWPVDGQLPAHIVRVPKVNLLINRVRLSPSRCGRKRSGGCLPAATSAATLQTSAQVRCRRGRHEVLMSRDDAHLLGGQSKRRSEHKAKVRPLVDGHPSGSCLKASR